MRRSLHTELQGSTSAARGGGAGAEAEVGEEAGGETSRAEMVSRGDIVRRMRGGTGEGDPPAAEGDPWQGKGDPPTRQARPLAGGGTARGGKAPWGSSRFRRGSLWGDKLGAPKRV